MDFCSLLQKLPNTMFHYLITTNRAEHKNGETAMRKKAPTTFNDMLDRVKRSDLKLSYPSLVFLAHILFTFNTLKASNSVITSLKSQKREPNTMGEQLKEKYLKNIKFASLELLQCLTNLPDDLKEQFQEMTSNKGIRFNEAIAVIKRDGETNTPSETQVSHLTKIIEDWLQKIPTRNK